MGVTIVASPVKVGRFVGSVGSASELVPVVPEVVSAGNDSVFAVVPEVSEAFVPVLVADVFPVFVAVADVLPFVFVAVERFGSSVVAAVCADAPIASSETARAVERSGVLRKSLMINVLSNYCAKR